MKKKNRLNILLLSTSGSKHFYITKKKKSNKNIFKIKKFDPKKKKHYIYKESKIK